MKWPIGVFNWWERSTRILVHNWRPMSNGSMNRLSANVSNVFARSSIASNSWAPRMIPQRSISTNSMPSFASWLFFASIWPNAIIPITRNEHFCPCPGKKKKKEKCSKRSEASDCIWIEPFVAGQWRWLFELIRVKTAPMTSNMVSIRMTHGDTSVDSFTIGSFGKYFSWERLMCLLCRYKSSYGIIELYRNNEIIYPTDDNKTLGQTDDRDRMVCSLRRSAKVNGWLLSSFRRSPLDGSSTRVTEVPVEKVVHPNQKWIITIIIRWPHPVIKVVRWITSTSMPKRLSHLW